MKRKILILLICLLSLASTSVQAENVAELESQLSSKKTEITQVENTIKDFEEKKKTLKSDILTINRELSDIQWQLDELSKKIEIVNAELIEAQKLEDEKKMYFIKDLWFYTKKAI